MYYHLNGELCFVEGNTAVIDCAGVGYRLTVSSNTAAVISTKTGDKVKLYTHLAVREDSMELFGFYSVQEHSVFRKLISVSGVGPKVAISVLSTLTPEQFVAAVYSGDAKTLATSKGLGLKGAERIILELKEKIIKEYGGGAVKSSPVGIQMNGKLSDAMNALLVLGYTKQEASEALNEVGNAPIGSQPVGSQPIDSKSMTLEALITAALKRLMK